MAMQDVYDFFYDVNTLLLRKGLERLDDMTRPAIMSGLLSDTLTASLARRRCGYTRRVQVETGFSMIKRRQGESVAACIRRTQDQELRLMVLTHNLMISYAP
ncbi:MAG TPA: hypothetical protein VHQ47_07250 [Phycisphaerae bacterium]|nr:hypothetical protein [Phycisphaerae bacterium]